MNSKLKFPSNNVNGVKSLKKRLKDEYLREKISNNGIIVLQETHSSEDALKKW